VEQKNLGHEKKKKFLYSPKGRIRNFTKTLRESKGIFHFLRFNVFLNHPVFGFKIIFKKLFLGAILKGVQRYFSKK
jgi:hypothetical protein